MDHTHSEVLVTIQITAIALRLYDFTNLYGLESSTDNYYEHP